MSRRLTMLLLAGTVLLAIFGLPALAQASGVNSVTRPKLSAAPVMGVPFTVSGVARPMATATSRTVVKIRLFMLVDGHWDVMDTYRARLSKNPDGPGTRYELGLTIPMAGKHAVRALHFRGGQLVKKSRVNFFDVMAGAQQIAIDATSHADVTAPAGTPIQIVFSNIGDGCGRNIHFQKASLFERTILLPLSYASDGLAAGRYNWECSMGPTCHGGTLAVQ